MCHYICISTNSDIDLSKFNIPNVGFYKLHESAEPEVLKYQYKWNVCMPIEPYCCCHFRINDADIGFTPLQEWMDECEDDEEVINTRWLFQIIKNLVNSGQSIDSLCFWMDDVGLNPEEQTLNVNGIVKEDFAFISNVYFEFKP